MQRYKSIYNSRFNHSRRRSKSSIRGFAYKMGCVERGLDNPDSLISASYNAGKNATPKKRKSLY